MAKNVYFSNGTSSEQRLYEDLIIESLKIYGHDVYYLPREIVKKDEIWNEDVLSKFDENYLIEMYLSNFEGFEGDGTLLTKFGVRISDEATFVISKRRWEDLISSSNNLVSSKRPNEGDVIYFPLTKQFFQIKFVEHEKPFRQLDAIQTYQLIAETMEFSDERFETGIKEIDGVTRESGYSIVFKLTDGIASVVLTNSGIGYGRNTTVVFGPPGANAKATVTVNTDGSIDSINLTDPGVGYITAPYINIVGSGSFASAVAVLANRQIFKTGEIVYGTSKSAKAISSITAGSLNRIDVYDTGSGYTTAPSVYISAPPTGGTQATATVVLTQGKVTSINITNPGSGYILSPTIKIQRSPLEPSGEVTRYDGTNKELELINITGTFVDNETLVGEDSGAEWVIGSFDSIEIENNPQAENEWFEEEGDKIIDFSSSNPFGEYGDMDRNYSEPTQQYTPPPTPVPTPSPTPAPIGSGSAGTIGGIYVDTSNLGVGTDNYIMVYDAETNKYIFVSPESLGVNNDENPDPNVDDFGTY